MGKCKDIRDCFDEGKPTASDHGGPTAFGRGWPTTIGQKRPTACGQGGPAAFGQGGPATIGQGRSTACGQVGRTDSDQRKKMRLERSPTLDATSAEECAMELADEKMPTYLCWSGSLLTRMAGAHREYFDRRLTWAADHYAGGDRTWATVCSGSEGAHFVMEAIADT